MNRRESHKELTRQKHDDIYKQITKIGTEMTVNNICDLIGISRATYYRIINNYKDNNIQEKKTIKKKSKKILDDNIIAGLTKDLSNNVISSSEEYLCPYKEECKLLERCPISKGIKIDVNDPIYTEFLTTHYAIYIDYINDECAHNTRN